MHLGRIRWLVRASLEMNGTWQDMRCERGRSKVMFILMGLSRILYPTILVITVAQQARNANRQPIMETTLAFTNLT